MTSGSHPRLQKCVIFPIVKPTSRSLGRFLLGRGPPKASNPRRGCVPPLGTESLGGPDGVFPTGPSGPGVGELVVLLSKFGG